VTPLADLGALRVAAVEVLRVDLTFHAPVRTANGVVTGRRPVLVRVLGTDGEEGWGECSAEDAPGYWHEYADACEVLLRQVAFADAVTVGTIPVVPGWPMASAAIECAVLDALCRRAEVSIASWLGGRRATVEATLTLGIDDDPTTIGPYRHVKAKVDGRGAVPPWATSADANGSLSVDAVAALADAGLDHLEQPLAVDDLVGHATLRRLVPNLPIALDESIRSVGDVRTVAALGAADIVVLKPGRLGGLLAARRAHDAAVAAGIRAKVGGMWDTGIGRAAALAVASLPGCSVAPDLAAADRYWTEDVVADPVTVDADGRLTVPTGPGLGIDVVLPSGRSG
jgi:O-succinylbenzoate synthase